MNNELTTTAELEETAGRAVTAATEQYEPTAGLLRVGNLVSAGGWVYRVRKVTNKDILIRPVGRKR